MDLKTANIAINKAIETANGIGVKFCIAVMDSGVNLVAFSRMDGGRVGTIDVAMKKVFKDKCFTNIVINLIRPEHLPCLFWNPEILARKVFLANLCMVWNIPTEAS